VLPDRFGSPQSGVVDTNLVVSRVGHPDPPIRTDRYSARTEQAGGGAFPRTGGGEVLDPAVPGIRHVDVLVLDRDSPQIVKAERPGPTATPASEGTAVAIEQAKARVTEVSDPDSSAVVDGAVARLAQIV
jgi:hypothetical protein